MAIRPSSIGYKRGSRATPPSETTGGIKLVEHGGVDNMWLSGDPSSGQALAGSAPRISRSPFSC